MYTTAFQQKMRGGAVRQNILIALLLSCLQIFLEPVDVFAQSDATASRVKPSKVTNTRVSNSRSSRSRVQRSRASNARAGKRTSSRARKENRMKKQTKRVSFATYWKQLPVKQKIKLYHSMVKTMAILELSHHQRPKRSTKTSSLYPFWQLFIAQAYAQESPDNVCFFGGHVLRQCDFDRARNDESKKCSLGDQAGVRCNRSIFPTAPCVYDWNEARSRGTRNYNTTQACSYADAQLIAQQLESDAPSRFTAITPDQKKAVVDGQMSNADLWDSDDPEEWIEKRNALIEEALGGADDAITRYNAALLNGADDDVIGQFFQAVRAACTTNASQKPAEQKYCTVFLNDVEELSNATQLGVGDYGGGYEGEFEGESRERRRCFKFQELPGEHFCQVKTGDNKYLVVRLLLQYPPYLYADAKLGAEVYQSNSPEGSYCFSSNFSADDEYGLTNFSNPNDLAGEQGIACNIRGKSHTATFSHQSQQIAIQKELGPSNRCLFKNPRRGDNQRAEARGVIPNLGDNETTTFFPGIASDDSFYDEALARNQQGMTSNGTMNDRKCMETSYVALYEASHLFESACKRAIPYRATRLYVHQGAKEIDYNTAFVLNQADYKSFDRLSIDSNRGTELTSKPIDPIMRNWCGPGRHIAGYGVPENCIQNKYRTSTDYWYGDGNGPNANNMEPSNGNWRTGLISELRHCGGATPSRTSTPAGPRGPQGPPGQMRRPRGSSGVQ